METSSPLFKGATRPACIGGVPLQVFVLNIGVISPITHFYLKTVADKDEQIFSQLISYARINLVRSFNRRYWGNVTSLSPKQEKKELFILEKSKE